MTIYGDNFRDAWERVNDYLLYRTSKAPDYQRSGITLHSFHNQVIIEHAVADNLELSMWGYTKTKWSMLMKHYFDSGEFAMLINRLKYYWAIPRHHGKYVVDIAMHFGSRMNRSGACLIGLCMRYSKQYGWECEVFSRASEITVRWGCDLIFIHVIIKEIGKHLGFDPKNVRVYWNSASMFQSIVNVPLYLQNVDLMEDFIDRCDPNNTWHMAVLKRYKKSYDVESIEDAKYMTFRSQKRSTKAFIAARDGLPFDGKGMIETKDLVLPPYDLDIVEENFFEKGGFR
jgi:hypothetical protein